MTLDIKAIPFPELPFIPAQDTAAYLWIPVQSAPENRAVASDHDGPDNWMDLRDVPDNADRLIEADDIVLTAPAANLVLTYPFDIAAVCRLEAENGNAFTRGELLARIYEIYGVVYQRDANTGEFVIRLHEVDALSITGIVVHRIDGEFWLEPEVDSFPAFLFDTPPKQEDLPQTDVRIVDRNDLPFTPGGGEGGWDIEVTSLPDDEDIADGVTEPFDWMDLRNIPGQFHLLINPEEVVLKATSATVVLVYPLDVTVAFEITPDDGKGFTRAELVRAIDAAYRTIYAIETGTQSAPTPPVEDRFPLLNRPPSDGTFGISGHDLDDLAISSIEVHEIDGRVWLDPYIQS